MSRSLKAFSSAVFSQKLFWLLPLLAAGCQHSQLESFANWYEHQQSKSPGSSVDTVYVANIRSKVFDIDTIYRSMQGPYEAKTMVIADDEELLWLTGYEARVQEAGTNAPLSDGFMCHNNLNLLNKDALPWKVKTLGTSTRLFTLTEGQTSVELPPGFGVPMVGGTELSAIAQVLNHNLPEADFEAYQDITIRYRKDSELSKPMTPLYQQAVFVTKQVSGPAGHLGHPPMCSLHDLDSNQLDGKAPNHQCAIEYDDDDYNPYRDRQGRTFTGHWQIPLGKEVLETEVTKMLNLSYNTTVHYIGVHLHPFAEWLELWDITADTMLYRAVAVGYQEGIGIKHIGHYSCATGIEVFANHRYVLRSSYNCTDSVENHTAMATMFLYLHDK